MTKIARFYTMLNLHIYLLDERERKRDLKSFPRTAWSRNPSSFRFDPLLFLFRIKRWTKRWLRCIHQNHSRKTADVEEFFPRIVESSVSEDPRIHRQLDIKGGRPVNIREARPRTCFLRGFLHGPSVSRAHAVGNDGARESQSRERSKVEGRGRRRGY